MQRETLDGMMIIIRIWVSGVCGIMILNDHMNVLRETIQLPEEKTLCPFCDPQKRKPMPKSKLQEHVKKAHLGFY